MKQTKLSEEEFQRWYRREPAKLQPCTLSFGLVGAITSLREKYDFETVEYKPFSREIVADKVTQARLMIRGKYYDLVLKDLSTVPNKERKEFEVKTSLVLEHENIVKFYRCLYEDKNYKSLKAENWLNSGRIFLAMEFCPLGASMTLDKTYKPEVKTIVGTVARRTFKTLKFQTYDYRYAYTTMEARDILTPIAEALLYLHTHEKGIAHLDIKPDNILLSEGHDGEIIPKLTDFGVSISREKLYKRNICKHAPGGTVTFQSLQRCKPFDPYKDDVWAFGLTMYVFLTGFLLSEKGFEIARDKFHYQRKVVSRLKKRQTSKYPWLKTWCQLHPEKRDSMETVVRNLKDQTFELYKEPKYGRLSMRSIMTVSSRVTSMFEAPTKAH